MSSTVGETGTLRLVMRELPYILMLLLAFAGIALTGFGRPTTHFYWMVLAPVYALIVVASGWRRLETGAERMRLVATQALHWLAFLGAMWLMFLPQVRGVDNDNATSLALLILLALGTFVAGVHAVVWRISAVGVFLAAIYGGYFGGGLGIIVLAVLGMVLVDTLTRINALKQCTSLVVNGFAAVIFLFSGHILWATAGVMLVCALLGGYLGGRVASRVSAKVLQRLVLVIGVVVAVVYSVRTFA